MSVTFQAANALDINTLIELMREFYDWSGLTFDDLASNAALRQLLNDKSLGCVWMIQLYGEIIGYFVLTFGFSLEFYGGTATIDELYIRPMFRGRGFGKHTLLFIDEAIQAMGVKALFLEVDRSNAVAQTLYEQTGFAKREGYSLMSKTYFRRAAL